MASHVKHARPAKAVQRVHKAVAKGKPISKKMGQAYNAAKKAR